MPDEFHVLDGDVVGARDLSIARAADAALRLAAGQLPYATLLECRRLTEFEVIVVEIEAEVPQCPVHDVRAFERIALVYSAEDDRMPGALALRTDFPMVPHLNVTTAGDAKSLCLFEESFIEMRTRLTAALLIERIREWLRLTARGELHAADQPLEPLIIGSSGRIIVPHAILSNSAPNGPPVHLTVTRRGNPDDKPLILFAQTQSQRSVDENSSVVAIVFYALPRSHGIIAARPRTLWELHEFLRPAGDDLLTWLRQTIPEWFGVAGALSARLLLLVVAPKTRKNGGPVEAHDLWAFHSSKTVEEVGIDVGVFGRHAGTIGKLIPPDVHCQGDAVTLNLLNVVSTLSRDDAARLSGRQQADETRIVSVGAGALGSQVAMNAARIGYGRWTLVDDDTLLPHNLTRHALQQGVGFSKAHSLAHFANGIVDADDAFVGIHADVLDPGQSAPVLAESFRTAEMILDMSASVPVARYLARKIDGSARRVSFFLNPRGTELVMLAEDRHRRVLLDSLEMQYYRAILNDDAFRLHLEAPQERVRYGRSCRDVSVRLSEEAVALHSALATRALRAVAENDGASIKVWQANVDTGEVMIREIQPTEPIAHRVNGWTVVLDQGLCERLRRLRQEKLPLETGGVLLGTYDLESRLVYLIDALPSPPDSEERPTWFIRGSEGLPREVALASERTGGQAEYVGEWHSHPRGFSLHPSADDVNLFMWLTTSMEAMALPAVMLIAGDQSSPAIFVGRIAEGQLQDENVVAVIGGVLGSND